MTLGERIAQLRTAKNLTLDDLAAASGVNRGTINALEVRKSRASRFAGDIARGLGVPLATLLGTDATPRVEEAPARYGIPASRPADVAQALEVLGIALARNMPNDVRQDAADLLAKLAMRHGAERHQHELIELLSGNAQSKRQRRA